MKKTNKMDLAFYAGLLCCVFALVLVVLAGNSVTRAKEVFEVDVVTLQEHNDAVSRIENYEQQLTESREKLAGMDDELQDAIDNKETRLENVYTQYVQGHWYDALLEDLQTSVETMTTFHETLGRSQSDLVQAFKASGTLDVDGSFSKLFLSTPVYYINMNRRQNNSVMTADDGIFIEKTNDNGQSLFVHPKNKFEWHIVDGDKTHCTVVAFIEYTLIERQWFFSRAMPVAMVFKCESPDGDPYNWAVTSVETYLEYGSTMHPEEGVVYTNTAGVPVDIH